MTMFETLGLGVLIFSLSLTLQIVTWHLKRVAREIHWLFAIYIVFPSAFFVVLAVCFDGMLYGLLLGYLIHITCALGVIFTYPTFKGDIPSIRILKFIHNNAGLTKDEVVKRLRTHPAFRSRKLDELVSERLVELGADGPTLSKEAKAIALVFLWYRKLLGSRDATG